MGPQKPETTVGTQPEGAAVPPPSSGPFGASSGGRRARFQSRRVRLALALGGGIMALLCLGGVGMFVSLYDRATEIKRTSPEAVVDNFLRAYLVNRDETQVSLYSCKEGADFEEIAGFRADVIEREAKYSVTINMAWEGLVVSTAGDQATVRLKLTRSIAESEQIADDWTFRVIDQDGWRVCGASEA